MRRPPIHLGKHFAPKRSIHRPQESQSFRPKRVICTSKPQPPATESRFLLGYSEVIIRRPMVTQPPMRKFGLQSQAIHSSYVLIWRLSDSSRSLEIHSPTAEIPFGAPNDS
ncbi:hypothetical protein CK203_019653 [Vitis vinifera]|uniref:Uncharacterized protein n=1 Tax=Vitis vinifera TaxID=29760 RepID=A0A438JQS3_VITVI|nr:hypothetical protein CK203_019653 [Vitis vinifera]